MNGNDTGLIKALIYVLLRKVDAGQTCSVDEAIRHVRAGDFFPWLVTSFGRDYGLGFFDEKAAADQMNEDLERQASGIHRSKIGIERNGFLYIALLCTELLEEYARNGGQPE